MSWLASGSLRVHRGGSWFGVSLYTRVASLRCSTPGDRGDYLALRLVRRVS